MKLQITSFNNNLFRKIAPFYFVIISICFSIGLAAQNTFPIILHTPTGDTAQIKNQKLQVAPISRSAETVKADINSFEKGDVNKPDTPPDFKNTRASASATYTAGNLPTDLGFQTIGQSSSCPGQLTVTIPAGAIISAVDVEYQMRAFSGVTISQQRSQLRCTSAGGTNEMSVTAGVGNTTGSYSYSRTGLNIANAVTGGGNIHFELHAGRTSNSNGCDDNKQRVNNNTWKVTVYYSVNPIPDFTTNPTSVYVWQPVTFTDASTGPVTSWSWDFGADAIPASANTQGPHSVAYSSSGLKTVSLTVNGAYTKTKTFLVNVADPVMSVSATYSGGDIPTDYQFQSLPGSSSCAGNLTVTIPVGAIISGVDVEYDMTGQNIGWLSEQRSQLRCVSSGGLSEATLAEGTGFYSGTQAYSRTGLEIANGVSGGGDIEFELHAGRTWTNFGYGCSTYNNYVRNNTWTVTVYFDFNPIANFYANNTFVDVGQTVTFTDISIGPRFSWNWNFGAGATPATANTQGPHNVIYNTGGYKNVSLTINGLFTQTKNNYIFVSDPNDWLKWDNNINNNIVGGVTYTWQSAVRFQPADFSSFGNSQITLIRVYIGGIPSTTTLKIWQGANQLGLVEKVSQVFTPVANSWNVIALSQPYIINLTQELWIGMEWGSPPSTNIFSAGIDVATSQTGKSNLYRTNVNDHSTWATLTSLNIAGDWNLQAYIVSAGSWIGVISSEWENPNNWYSSTVPIAATDVNIPITPHNPEVGSYAEINDLTIESGASLSILPDFSLKVNGTIVNSAGTSGLVVQSDVTGTGSLLNTTSGVQGTFQRYVKGDPEAWHGFSSPMTAQEISGEFTPTGTYGDGTGYDFYTWYEPDTSWIYLLNTSFPPTWADANGSNYFLQGKGYLASYQATNPTLNFVGTLATGSVNVPITLTTGVGDQFGSNLLGNPYPSSIDWKASTGWTRTDLDLSGGGYNVWIWNDTAYNYGVYNSASTSDIGTLGVTRHIPPTQGFFVLAAQTGTLGITDDVRVNDGSSNWLKSKGDKPEQFFLSIISVDGQGDDEIMIEIDQEDLRKGSYKRFSFVPAAPSLWIPRDGQFYSSLVVDSIQQYPVLPLAFKAGQNGSFILKSEFDRSTISTALLIDNQTGLTHDLIKEYEINFLASDSDNPGRFILQFAPGYYANPHEQLPVRIFTHNQILYLDLRLVDTPCQIEMYNVIGKKIFNTTHDGGLQYQINFPDLQGAFVVRVIASSGQSSKKVAF